MATKYEISRGSAHPLGATPDKGGVNFSVFSEHATEVELLLFESHDAKQPFQTIFLDPKRHNSFHFWHVYAKGLKPGICYAYRVDGPHDPSNGHRFDKKKILIDPYARALTSELWQRDKAIGPEDNLEYSMRSVVVESEKYNGELDKPPRIPMSKTIIYELHPGGFTKSPTANVPHPGKFYGIIEKIPYLKELGVTAVELMPVMDFDSSDIRGAGGGKLRNYWGYGTIGYFAPENSYCVLAREGSHVREFRDLVKALHKAGIEVILDVVFGYSGEGDQNGPTISMKGLDNSIYYLLSPANKEYYMNFSGCGNTLKANHPIVAKFITDCLEYWVREMHVDGFRFDEGSILSRDEFGNPMLHPPVLWNIELSAVLKNVKIIAEAWDAAGLYQVGKFPGYRFAEWNGHYRDDIRRFVRGDNGMIGIVAERICGSPDLYESSGRLPSSSINFISSHDGFTLYDLVSYSSKHNEANGNNNTDGADENFSANYGAEGPADNKEINDLRDRQIRNFLTILLLSRGVPMLSMGDEVKRTQKGNNNTYCQDNEISWFDWEAVRKNSSLLEFVKKLIRFRQDHFELTSNQYLTGELNSKGLPDVTFHGCKLHAPGFDDSSSRVLAITFAGQLDREDIHLAMNMSEQDLEFEIPKIVGRSWRKKIDTGSGFVSGKIASEKIKIESHTIIVLTSE